VRNRLMSPAERLELWARWRRGEAMRAIARALQRPIGTVYRVVQPSGGLPPRVRQRGARALTLAERDEIAWGLAAGRTLRALSRGLGRAASTISREVRRHGGRPAYRASRADAAAWAAGRRPQPCRLAQSARLRRVVARKLAADWSPEQIAGWLRTAYPEDLTMQVSHETIYRSLFVQSRGVLRASLRQHLRRRRALRHARTARTAGQGRGQIRDAVSIRARPPEVEDRAVPGHWEGDLLTGTAQSHIATLVERQSRYVLLVKLPGKDTTRVIRALTRTVRTLPRGLMSTLTWDRGPELAAHARFTVATDVQVYFCDPQSPWQRGSNENTNGLLRQYFPKGHDLSHVTQRQLNAVARRLNTRPRKTLGFNTPAAVLATIVASTG
jgi:IS30 family transposase